MTVYRICKKEYKNDLTGLGSFLYGGRWNFPESYMLYTASSIALAALEVLVNYTYQLKDISFSLISIDISPEKMTAIEEKKLKDSWLTDVNYTQKIGTDFLTQDGLHFLEVPSSVINRETNVLINPKFITKKNILSIENFQFDKRIIDSLSK
jgi:RES domain-containing protein